eukprot:1778722-Amphidinium_carterae.1
MELLASLPPMAFLTSIRCYVERLAVMSRIHCHWSILPGSVQNVSTDKATVCPANIQNTQTETLHQQPFFSPTCSQQAVQAYPESLDASLVTQQFCLSKNRTKLMAAKDAGQARVTCGRALKRGLLLPATVRFASAISSSLSTSSIPSC